MQGCPSSTSRSYKPADGPQDFTVHGPAIVNPYWPGESPLTPSFGVEQVAVFVPVGATAVFHDALGEVYVYQDNDACLHNIPIEMADSGRVIVQVGDLIKEGLVSMNIAA